MKQKIVSIVLVIVLAMTVMSNITAFAYTVKTNGTATAKIDMTYMLPDGSKKVFGTAYVSKNDKVQVFCKDGNYYLILVPFNHDGSKTTNDQWFIGYADASKIKVSSGSIQDASDFYLKKEGKTNSNATLYHQPSTKTLKGSTTDVTKRATISKDTDVVILFQQGDYYFIKSGSVTGFIVKNKVDEQIVNDGTTSPVETDANDSATGEQNVKPEEEVSQPSPEIDIPCEHPATYEHLLHKNYVEIDSNTHNYQQWFNIYCEDDDVLIESDKLVEKVENHTFSGDTCTLCGYVKLSQEKTAYVYNTDGYNLNVRDNASSSAKIKGRFKAGSTITVIGEKTNGFYKVRGTNRDTGKSIEGYASATYITFTEPSAKPTTGSDNIKDLLGKRLADFNSAAYKSKNVSYRGGYAGQCTWYCVGRAYEKTGILIKSAPAAKKWVSISLPKGAEYIKGSAKVRANSIAIKTGGENGHVLFVEDVIGDWVYYTEANVPLNNKIDKTDGILKRKSLKSFTAGVTGYIYLG